MNTLPNEVLLQIFKYLGTYELIFSVSRVCSKWREISKDKSLWLTVDCSHFPKKVATRRKVLKNYLKPTTLEIKFESNFRPTDSFLDTIKKLSPCLNIVDLSYCNLTNMNLECLPMNVEVLKFSHCKIDCMKPTWNFKFVIPIVKRPRLKELYLDYFTSVNQEILHYWEQASPNLIRLDLSGCYRLSYINIHAMLSSFMKLEELRLRNMDLHSDSFCNTNNMLALGSSKTLKRIDISENRFLKEDELHKFMEELRKSADVNSLEELNLSGSLSKYIHSNIFDILRNLPELKHLIVSDCDNIRNLFSLIKKPSWLVILNKSDE